MPINGQSVGKDFRIDILYGGRALNISGNAITRFAPKPINEVEKRRPIDGKSRFAVHNQDWTIDVELDRLDSGIDDFWASMEEAYHNGVTTLSGTVTETILEPDGGVSEFRYEGCVFNVTDIGDRTADQIVKMKLEIMASRRRKVQ